MMHDTARQSVFELSPATSLAKQPVFEPYPVVDTVNTFYNDGFHYHGRMEDTDIDLDDLCCYDLDDCCYDYDYVAENTELDPDDLCCYDYDYIMEGIMDDPSVCHGLYSCSDLYTNGTGLKRENLSLIHI